MGEKGYGGKTLYLCVVGASTLVSEDPCQHV